MSTNSSAHWSTTPARSNGSSGEDFDQWFQPKRTEELQYLYATFRHLEESEELDKQPHSSEYGHRFRKAPESGWANTSRDTQCDSPLQSSGSPAPKDQVRRDMSTKEATIDCDILPGACGAKTSFTRKIGACPRCRIKKIECKHLDLIEFESAYQSAKVAMASSNSTSVESTRSSRNVDLLGLEIMPLPQHVSIALVSRKHHTFQSPLEIRPIHRSIRQRQRAIRRQKRMKLRRQRGGPINGTPNLDDGEYLIAGGGCFYHFDGNMEHEKPVVSNHNHANSLWKDEGLPEDAVPRHSPVVPYLTPDWYTCERCCQLNPTDWHCMQCNGTEAVQAVDYLDALFLGGLYGG